MAVRFFSSLLSRLFADFIYVVAKIISKNQKLLCKTLKTYNFALWCICSNVNKQYWFRILYFFSKCFDRVCRAFV